MRSVIARARTVSGALVFILLVSGCAPGSVVTAVDQTAKPISSIADPAPQFTTNATAVTSDGGSVEQGGVHVTVPKAVTTDGSDLKVSIGEEIGQAKSEFATEMFGIPVRVDHTADLSKTVTIEWDVSMLRESQQGLSLVRWNEELGMWVTSNEVITVEDDTATVEVQEFSTVSWTQIWAQKIGEMTDKRIDEPTCTGADLANWVDNTVDPDEGSPNAAIRVCFDPDRDDIVTVRIGNNRTFAQVLQLNDVADDFKWRWNGDDKFDITATVYNAAHTVLDDGDTMVLPPLSTQAIGIGRPSANGSTVIVGSANVGWQSVLTDVIALSADAMSIGGTKNPALDAVIQVLFECGGSKLLGRPGTVADWTRGAVDAIGGCADEILRPDSEFGQRFETLSRQLIAKGGFSSTATIQLNRAARGVSSAFKALKVADLAFYASDQFANSLVGPLVWSISGRGAASAIGEWSASCSDTASDSDRLYRNIALQDQFANTSKELWQYTGWAAAVQNGVAPLQTCTNEYRQELADMLPGSWADAKAAKVVATAVMALSDACTNIYSVGMLDRMKQSGFVLNTPPYGLTLDDVGTMGLSDETLSEILGMHSEDLTCNWFTDSLHYGLSTRISDLTPDEAAIVRGRLEEPGYEREEFGGGTRYSSSGTSSLGDFGESFFLRGTTWIVSTWSGSAPSGYTRDIVENMG
jgi:hypothetical protein